MKVIGKKRLFTALWVLCSVLFMQLALAAYACPGIAPAVMEQTVRADMPDCSGMDMTQPALCHAHDQAGNQSLDKPQSPDIQPFIAATLLLSIADIDMAYRPAAPHTDQPLLSRATAPPHAIQHCCFRI